MMLSCRHVRLFATAEAARCHEGQHPNAWCTTFAALTQALSGPQPGHDGKVLRSIEVLSTRLIMRGLKHPSGSTALSAPNDADARRFAELRALSRALLALRAAGITGEHRQLLPKASPSVAALLHDLHAYEEALAHSHLADTADVQRGALLRAASDIRPSHLQALAHVTVEPGVQLFDLRRDLLRVLTARGVQVTVRLPYSPTEPATTPFAEAMLHGFEAQQRGGVTFEFLGSEAAPTARPIPLGAALAHSLTEAAADATWLRRCCPEASRAVVVDHLPPGDALVTYVVRTLHAWQQEGVAPADMAVVLPRSGALKGGLRPEQLGPALVRALGADGFPCHTTAGPPLSDHPAAQRLLAALQLALQLEALPPPPAAALFDEAGIQLADWASGLQHSGAPVAVTTSNGDELLTPMAQANLLRRCGHRRLGPRGLRRALGALRGVGREVADAVAQAAEAWLQAWVLPLTGGRRALPTRIAHLVQLLGHMVVLQPPADTDAMQTVDAMAQTLEHLAATAHSIDAAALMSLSEAHGWIAGVLAEQRGPRAISGLPVQGAALLTAREMVGRRFSHVLALGLNNLAPGTTTGPLSEANRRELNQGLGYKLLQFGAVTGRAALPLGAEEQFYFYELLRGVTQRLHAVVLQLADEEQAEPYSELQRLGICLGHLPPAAPAAQHPVPWYDEPTTSLRLRGLTAAFGLPWALEATSNAPVLLQLQAGAERLHPAFWRSRSPLAPAHTTALRHTLSTQVVGVSSLDQLAMCQYRYFAGPMLGLNREPHPEHHIDRRRAGEAAHRALFHIYTALLHQAPWPSWAQNSAAAHAHAARTFAAQEALIVPRAWVHDDLRTGALAAVWHTVVTQLTRDLARTDAVPTALEYRFGDPVRTDRPALDIVHPQNAGQVLRVRGSIDRIDLGPAHVHVIDYKSSLPKRHPDRHVQLGLYQAVALRDFVPEARTTAATWQLLGQPTQGASERRPEELAGPAQDIVRRTQAAVWQRLDGLLSGDITPDPLPTDICTHCDFIHLCRYAPDATGVTAADAAEPEAP